MYFRTLDAKCCTDCLMWQANGDDSGFCDHADPSECADTHCEAVRTMDGWHDTVSHVAIGNDDAEFSTAPCDLCGDTLAGDRYGVSVVQPCSVDDALANAYQRLDDHVADYGLTAFDMGGTDMQGSTLGLFFAVADVLLYHRDLPESVGDANNISNAFAEWQYRPGQGQAWEPREDFSEGEYADDCDQWEREDLYATLSVGELIALGNECHRVQVLIEAAGKGY